MTKNKLIIIASVVVVLVAVSLVWFRKSQLPEEAEKPGEKDNQEPEVKKPLQPTPSDYPLKYNSKGEEVKKLQRYLNRHIAPLQPLKEDGIWGTLTQGAFMKVFPFKNKFTYNDALKTGIV